MLRLASSSKNLDADSSHHRSFCPVPPPRLTAGAGVDFGPRGARTLRPFQSVRPVTGLRPADVARRERRPTDHGFALVRSAKKR